MIFTKHDDVQLFFEGSYLNKPYHSIRVNKVDRLWNANTLFSKANYYAGSQTLVWIESVKLKINVDYVIAGSTDIARINTLLKEANENTLPPAIKTLILLTDAGFIRYLTSIYMTPKNSVIDYNFASWCHQILLKNAYLPVGAMRVEVPRTGAPTLKTATDPMNERSLNLLETSKDIDEKLKKFEEYVAPIKVMATFSGKDTSFIDDLMNSLRAIPKTLVELADLLDKHKANEKYIECINDINRRIQPFIKG